MKHDTYVIGVNIWAATSILADGIEAKICLAIAIFLLLWMLFETARKPKVKP